MKAITGCVDDRGGDRFGGGGGAGFGGGRNWKGEDAEPTGPGDRSVHAMTLLEPNL